MFVESTDTMPLDELTLLAKPLSISSGFKDVVFEDVVFHTDRYRTPHPYQFQARSPRESYYLSLAPKGVTGKGSHEKLPESCRKAAEKSEFRGSLARKCAAFGEYPVVTPFPLPLSGPANSTTNNGNRHPNNKPNFCQISLTILYNKPNSETTGF